MIKVATVCSGIGSPEQALRNIGVAHQIPFACEIDKYARQTYLANFNPDQMYTDMTKEEWDKPEQYSDLFIGGIPCQAFSLAGKRLGELDKRGLLFYDFYRYVKNQQPKVFIIENVKGLLSDAGGKTFQNWIQLLGKSMNQQNFLFTHEDSLMYNLHFEVLNSKDFGVPQNRERVFLIGVRNDLPNTFRFPPGFRLTKRLKDILEPEVDEKYYLSDKLTEKLTLGKKGSIEVANLNKGGQMGTIADENGEYIGCLTAVDYKLPKMILERKVNKLGFINQDTQGSAVYSTENRSPTVCAGTHGYAMGYIKESNEIMIACNIPGKHEATGRVYNTNGISPCVTAKQGGGHEPKILEPEWIQGGLQAHQYPRTDGLCPTLTSAMGMGGGQTPIFKANHRIRRLTPLECMRLQGFPDEYIKPCSDSQTYKQAGNSITVNVMEAIIRNLLHLL